MSEIRLPTVSIIMPMRNAENYVFDAINSILKQQFEDFELLVVDDGSTDSSRKIVEGFPDLRVRIIDGPKTGGADAFNRGLTMAKGTYVCNCDADDLYTEDRLLWQVAFLDKYTEFGAVCSTYSTMQNDGQVLAEFDCGQKAEEITQELSLGQTRTSFCTFLTRIEILKELDGYRSYFVSSYDIDLQLRMAEDHKIWYEPINSYYYRLHDSSMTHTQSSNKRVFFEETARAFLQQRREHGKDDLQLNKPPEVPVFEMAADTSLRQVSGILISEAWRLHRLGEKKQAIGKGISACRVVPTSFVNWRNLLALIIK